MTRHTYTGKLIAEIQASPVRPWVAGLLTCRFGRLGDWPGLLRVRSPPQLADS